MKIVLLLMIAMAVCVVEGKKGTCKANGRQFGLTKGYRKGCVEFTCRCKRRTDPKTEPCTDVRWQQKRICSPSKPWIVSWTGGNGTYYDHPAYSSEQAHRACESTGGVVAEMDSQNELDAVSQYADDNLQHSNAICEKPTEREDCFEKDTDFYGNDINLSTARTLDRRNSSFDCQALCRERKGCLYFTWKRISKNCFLKSEGGPGKENVYMNEEATSGPRTCGTRVDRKNPNSRNRRSRRKRAEKYKTPNDVHIYVVMKF